MPSSFLTLKVFRHRQYSIQQCALYVLCRQFSFLNFIKSSPLVWFITGTSQGFGLELVRGPLERGDKVIATSRTPEKIQAVFPNLAEQLLVLSVNLTDDVQVKEAVEQQ